jgi:hypothetical protein
MMFKKIFLILFILIGLHSLSNDYDKPTLSPSFDHVLAAAQTHHTENTKQDIPSISDYIVPAAAGLILMIGISTYWLFYRKKQI